MKQIAITDNPQDVQQHCRDGVLLLPNGKYGMFSLYDRENDRVHLDVLEPTDETVFGTNESFARDDLKIVWPMVGAINVSPELGAVYVSRIGRQQYRRVFSMRLCRTVSLSRSHVPEDTLILAALCYPKWPTVSDLWSRLNRNRAVAIDYTFTIVPRQGPKSPLVYDGTQLIGVINREGALMNDVTKFVRRRWEDAYDAINL